VPLVSIILPIYNRAAFVPDALRAIADQTWREWELIVIDDGSTDDTVAAVERHRGIVGDRLLIVRQENRGAYGARNTGLDHATGDYIAFYDSDDLWLPQYLEECVQALERNPELDWVYAACRAVDAASGAVLAGSTFADGGRPRPFLSRRSRPMGKVSLIDDPAALECQIESGLYAGLQNSVIRRRVFAGRRFWEDYRVVEDVLFLIRSIASGLRIGYLRDVLVVYRVHGDNSSASSASTPIERLLPILDEQVRGFRRLQAELPLSRVPRRKLARQIGRMQFWRAGYNGYWASGRRAEGLAAFRAGLRSWPWDVRMWKTYVVCRLRLLFEGR
jgi:glycosyltransferase involved in cell wall biosynthesis